MKTSHIINILSKLLKKDTLCSNDILASNSNQYFCTIKNNGIELVEVKKANLTNKGYHLERKLHFTDENIERAEKYLKRLRGTL